MRTEAPSPPRVHAPSGTAAPSEVPVAAPGTVQQVVGTSAGARTATPAGPPVVGGAEVTAVVPGGSTPVPPVSTPTTSTPTITATTSTSTPVHTTTTPEVATPAAPPGTELARTGLDAGPLLVLALALVLLGVLLTRTASVRPSR